MKTLSYHIQIDASRKKVWNTLWNDSSYREWTSVFTEGSYAVSDWKEGSKVLFLTPKNEGLYSNIDKLIPNELMSFKHIGVIKDGEEQPMDEATQKWSGAKENYTLREYDGRTELVVELDATESDEEYFKTKFPLALQRVKDLCEQT